MTILFNSTSSPFSAHGWLEAAGRADLMVKPLNNLTKYHLCSEHFKDECFMDPDTKTRLKRTYRPVSVPVPTIFKCNFRKLIPKDISFSKPLVVPQWNSSLGENPLQLEQKESEETREEKNGTAMDEAQEDETQSTFTITVTQDGEIVDTQVVEPGVVPSLPSSVCRLCCTAFAEDESRMNIFKSKEVVAALDVVLPGEINEQDPFSHLVCLKCVRQLHTARTILSKFRGAQEMFRVE